MFDFHYIFSVWSNLLTVSLVPGPKRGGVACKQERLSSHWRVGASPKSACASVSSSSSCTRCCRQGQLVKSGDALYVQPLPLESPVPHFLYLWKPWLGLALQALVLRPTPHAPSLWVSFPPTSVTLVPLALGFCPAFICPFHGLYFSFWS